MLLYITLGTNDVDRARRFYDAALAPLGMTRSFENESEIGYGENPPPPSGRQRYFYVTKPYLRCSHTDGGARLSHGGFGQWRDGRR
jgi:catechol 2,3-dioxygenase-like lactoylglutathione lyase family enzyme